MSYDTGDIDARVMRVAVDVVPDGRDFNRRIRQQVEPDAARLGQRLGQQISGPIGSRLATTVQQGILAGGRDAAGKGARVGEDYATAFGRTIRARLTAAFRGLPDIEVGLDTSDVQRKAAAVRAELLTLGNQTIGVDISDDEAIVRLQALRLQLSQLAREIEKLKASDPEIRVDVDALKAFAEITGLKRELQQLQAQANRPVRVRAEGEDATGPARAGLAGVGAAAGFARSGMAALVAAAFAIGPAIIPAAAAASVALGSIATAAFAGAAGVGVLVLGLWGVGAAVGAMSKAQSAAGRAAAGGASSMAAQATAAEGLTTAKRNLANTILSVADAQVRSTQRVEAADADLIRAQREAARAQTELTAAREAARDAQEDLNAAVDAGGRSERQARIDLARAREALERAQKTPSMRLLDRQQVKLDFDTALARLQQVQRENGRLAEAKTAADAAGIDGSEQMVTANDNLVRALDRVKAAEQDVDNARREAAAQARESAAQIESAQLSVVQAQRAVQQAAQQGGGGASAAMLDLKEKMDDLSPAGQRFALFLFGLRGELTALRFAAQESLLPGLQEGITLLLPFLPRVTAFTSQVGRTLGTSFVGFVASMKDPTWQRFFGYVSQTAVPALQGMLAFINNIARGSASLIVALSPFNSGIGRGLIGISEAFARWADELDRSQGFQQFLAYVATNGPKVIDLIGGLVTMVGRLVAAGAPVGSVVLSALIGITDAINSIPMPILTVLVATITAVGVAMTVATVAQSAWTLATRIATVAQTAYAAAQNAAGAATQQYVSHMATASARTGQFGGALTMLNAGASAARSGLSSLVGFLGGPWGIALAAATIAVAAFAAAEARVDAAAQEMGASLRGIAGAFEQGGDAAVIALARQDKAVAESLLLLNRYGATAKDVFNAQKGDAEAQARILAALEAKRQGLLQPSGPGRGGVPGMARTQIEGDLKILDKAIADQKERYELARLAAEAYGDSTEKVGQESARTSLATQAYGQRIGDLEVIYEALTGKTRDASAATEAFRRYTEDATSSARSAIEAEEEQARSLIALRDTLGANSAGFDLATAKSDTHRRSVLSNRDALQDALRAVREKTLADIEAKVSLEDASAAAEQRIESILAEIPAAERNSAVVQSMVDAYGRLPPEVTTQFKTSGAEAVLQQLKDLKVAQYALEKNLTIPAARSAMAGQLSQFESQVPRYAAGGRVFGAGTRTSDSVPALLSVDEHVWAADEVDAAGGHQAVYALRAAALAGRLPRYARGGQVWPFTVDVAGTAMPNWRAAVTVSAAGASSSGFRGYADGGPVVDYIPAGVTLPGGLSSSQMSGVPGGWQPRGGDGAAAGGGPLVAIDSWFSGGATANETAAELDWIIRSRGGR